MTLHTYTVPAKYQLPTPYGCRDVAWTRFYRSRSLRQGQTRGMLLLTKAKRPLKFKMLCGFNKHAVKLRMHKAALYAFPIPLNTF